MWSAVSAFGTGFAVGLSLIMAIGAQNAFVFRQALIRRHVFAVAMFCACSDALLIAVGVGGISLLIADFATKYFVLLSGLASLWLTFYGALRLFDAIRGGGNISHKNGAKMRLLPTLAVTALLTFGNPHVYLDTVVLVGAVSLQFEAVNKLYYGFGAVIASFAFFFSLAYGARVLGPFIERPNAWRIIDAGTAVIMFALALSMLRAARLI